MRHHTQLIFVFLVDTGFYHVVQVGLKLLTSDDLLALASQSARITGMSHHTQPKPLLDLVTAFRLLTFCFFTCLMQIRLPISGE